MRQRGSRGIHLRLEGRQGIPGRRRGPHSCWRWWNSSSPYGGPGFSGRRQRSRIRELPVLRRGRWGIHGWRRGRRGFPGSYGLPSCWRPLGISGCQRRRMRGLPLQRRGRRGIHVLRMVRKGVHEKRRTRRSSRRIKLFPFGQKGRKQPTNWPPSSFSATFDRFPLFSFSGLLETKMDGYKGGFRLLRDTCRY